MRRALALIGATVTAVAAALVVVASPAQAHGYISSPPSRQAMCAQGRVQNCGEIIYEPQSVEGPKGLRSCSGGNARFAQLDDESKGWPATSVGSNVTFNWVLTVQHRTRDWEYWIGGTRVGYVNDGGAQPPANVSHNVNLGGFSGRVKLLAIWNIYDTGNAFYACVDLQIGGGGGNPDPDPDPTTSPDPDPGGTWAANAAYAIGNTVTYGGSTYRCLQPHTALPGWEPPYTPALWQKL